MIAYLQGVLLETGSNFCVLLTGGGTGYEVFLPSRSLAGLRQGQEASFYIYTQVREDALELFGFETWDERETFEILISINRVGARTALAILGVFRPDELRRLVLDDDLPGLTRVPGIGRKSAQQIFLELKYKLKLTGPVSTMAGTPAGLYQDAVAGLANLGYAESEASLAVKEALAANPGLEEGELIRAALKRMSRRK